MKMKMGMTIIIIAIGIKYILDDSYYATVSREVLE